MGTGCLPNQSGHSGQDSAIATGQDSAIATGQDSAIATGEYCLNAVGLLVGL